MIFFIISVCLYAGILLLYRPSPQSLKEDKITYWENFRQIKASLFTGILLLSIFFVTSDFHFITTNETLYKVFGLSNSWSIVKVLPFQVITHLLMHANWFHVISNVSSIGLLSVYERRVGSKRFLMVLLIGSIASIPSVFFYSNATILCGISGGVMALAAAYFSDHENITSKEWMHSILGFIILAIFLSIPKQGEAKIMHDLGFTVDHIGHFFGAVGGIIYCRLRPRHMPKI